MKLPLRPQFVFPVARVLVYRGVGVHVFSRAWPRVENPVRGRLPVAKGYLERNRRLVHRVLGDVAFSSDVVCDNQSVDTARYP